MPQQVDYGAPWQDLRSLCATTDEESAIRLFTERVTNQDFLVPVHPIRARSRR
jgi:hypothetical protein